MINIDLTKYYNHKFIYREEKDIETRGLDGTYILAKDVKEKLEVTTRLDNISCDSQVIELNYAASTLHILGFAYWGSTNEFIDIVYEDEVKRVKVPFIDWVQPSKDNYETRSWFGRDVKTVMKVNSCGVLHHTVYFHESMIELDSTKLIKQIVLPDNFLIHIFKITIED